MKILENKYTHQQTLFLINSFHFLNKKNFSSICTSAGPLLSYSTTPHTLIKH